MNKLIAPVLALAALSVLTGCASLGVVDSEVSSYSRWPAGRLAASYLFERLPSHQAHPQEAQALEDAARGAVEAAGFVPAAEGVPADVAILLGARLSETERSPFDDPFWYGPPGTLHRSIAYGRLGRPYAGWRYGLLGPVRDYPGYAREVAVLIRDRKSGEALYEARAQSEGSWAALATLLPALFGAALKDFPAGGARNPHRVRIATTN
ncbi:MAG: DUF4136 domain-containing protein [Caldimonas sp.]